jgi:hypothetical protein
MKKAAFVCAGLLFFSPFISASSRTEFRALGECQFSHLSIIPSDGQTNPQQSPRLAFSAGVGFCFPLLKTVSLETNILYRTKKSELTRFSGIEWNDTYYRMQCLTIPLLARIGFPVSSIEFFAVFGVQGDWIFKSRIEDRKNDIRIEPIPGLKSYDLQAVGGVGIRRGRVSVEFKYEYGLLNLSKDKDSGLSIRSRGFELMLSFRLF